MLDTQKNKKTIIIITLVLAAFSAVLRGLLVHFNFDFDTCFFNNNNYATAIYIGIILIAVALHFLFKKVSSENDVCEKDANIFDLLLLVLFIVLFFSKVSAKIPLITIEKVAHVISAVAAFCSAVYYAVSYFCYKNLNKELLRLVNLAPVIYLIAILISTFVAISGKANSFYQFPHLLSVLVIAFWILRISKSKIALENSNNNLISLSAIVVVLVAFSAFPDAIFIISKKMSFNTEYIFLTVFKLIHFSAAICYICKSFIKPQEEKK